jgi:hypothetical protein
MGLRLDVYIDFQMVAASDSAGRMNHDRVAAVGSLGIERLLNT